MTTPQQLRCDADGGWSDNLRCDVVNDCFNMLNKSARWNCDKCYEEQRAKCQQERGDA